jgi:hypothetical protein
VNYEHTQFKTIEEKVICKINIEQSQPAFINNNGDKYFYTRIGNSSKTLDVEDTTKYIHQHWELYKITTLKSRYMSKTMEPKRLDY